MQAWPRCAPISLFWKKPGNEGADQPGYRYVTSVGVTYVASAAWLSAGSVNGTGEGDGPKHPDGIGRNAFAGGSLGTLVLVGTVSSRRQRPAIGAGASLAERRGQQARAQEHEAGRGQDKKSVGDNVVVAHDTPTTQMLVRIY